MQIQAGNIKIHWIKGLLVLFVAVCCFNGQRAYAGEVKSMPEIVKEQKEGIVRMIAYCGESQGNRYYVKQGIGFIVGAAGDNQYSDNYYIVTDHQLITISEEDMVTIKRQNGISPEAQFNTGILIDMGMGVTVEATVISKNTLMGCAILTPQTSLANRKSLRLADGVWEDIGQEIYAFGYQEEQNLIGKIYNENLEVYEYMGNVNHIDVNENKQTLLSMDIDFSGSNAGTPILDKDGYVAGILLQQEDHTFRALVVSDIRKLLDTLGVQYQGIMEQDNQYNVPTEEIIIALKELLFEYQNFVMESGNNYTVKSLRDFKTTLAQGGAVLNNVQSTLDDYNYAIEAMEKSYGKLKKPGYIFRFFNKILLGLILLLVFNDFLLWRKGRNYSKNRINSRTPRRS